MMRNITFLLVLSLALLLMNCRTTKTPVEPKLDEYSLATETAVTPKGTEQIPALSTQVSLEPTFVTPEGVTCSAIYQDGLQSLEFNTVSMETLKQWQEEEFPFSGVTLESSADSLRWEYLNGFYNAQFRNDTLIRVDILWKLWDKVFLEPTATDILTCFGQPNWYQAVRNVNPQGTYVELSLWYPEKGIIVYSEELYYNSQAYLPLSSDATQMTMMSVVSSGTIEEVVRNVYTPEEDNSFQNEVLRTLQPWPSFWNELKVKGCLDRFKECPD